ncbi:conserved exported hypothetical protein [uncultured Paludibacter sp.]|nr:conserved exported hypothetical protein [uncultured Paludibacter sp.]
MKTLNKKSLTTLLFIAISTVHLIAQDIFPDGTQIPEWFSKTETVNIKTLGKQYVITKYGVKKDSALLQTEKIQKIIDLASNAGGGVIIVPKGTFLTGSLFFKPKTHLYLAEGAVLKGSDNINNFPVVETRIEGETCKYFPAVINADKVDGFTLSGKGTINGNGLRYWKAFWLRREWNPKCTNKDEMRPRLVYISNSNDVQISGVTLQNSPFWTSHYYKCNNLKILNVTFFSPVKPVKSPSTDAIDIDVCSNVLVKGCYMEVNDDAIALKGGKGPTSDKNPNNGGNYNIIIEDCTYGFCHSALTCGSESIHDRNIILRRCKLNNPQMLLHLKMRPDTPQKYEYILIEDIAGEVGKFISVRPWTQFFDLKGENPPPPSRSGNVTMRNINLDCETFFDVAKSEKYILSGFTFENLNIKAKNDIFDQSIIRNLKLENVKVNDVEVK